MSLKNKLKPGRGVVIGIPFMWLLILFLIPFLIVFKISFAEQELSIPPYTQVSKNYL